ncbi:MAG: oxidoreductase [Betaproteobacteria bacterium]|nr:MAG: oxidoreductase [Betaproteobacteria bacterium]
MRAVTYDRYGPPDVLHVAEVADPVPAAGEVLVRIEAASLNPLDWKLREGHLRFAPPVKAPPRGTGTDLAGTIVAVGGGPGPRHVGERVFGSLSPFGRAGSCAEACVVAVHRLAPVPDGVAADAAACLPIAGGTAVQALADDAQLASGQRLLVVGAAGGVGHFAVQYAKHAGARVVGVCGPDNVAFVAGLGADRVIDYRSTDVLASGETFDVIFDAANALDWRRAQRLLARGGLYLGTAGSTTSAIATGVGAVLAPWFGGTRARNVVLNGGAAAWRRLGDLAARGILAPHVERRVGLEEVAGAQAAMQTGHGRGKVVVLPQLMPRAAG